MKLLTLFFAIATLIIGTNAHAGQTKIGDLVIDQPVARATVPGQKVGGGYLTITNNGTETDRLIGGMASFSGKVEIHEMKMENEVMKMAALPDGLEIAPGETVTLKPGGFHIMFMKLAEPLKAGDQRAATLVFEKAGKVHITFDVLSVEETMKMKDGKMDHGSMKKEGE